jgi:hypothetical protein
MAARALFLGLAVLATGCRTTLPAARSQAVEVRSVEASFSGADRGELKLSLEVENPQTLTGELTRVAWELWLNGRWFAAGLQAVNEPLTGRQLKTLELTLPVVFRHLEVRTDPTIVEVGVRGGVDLHFGGVSFRLPFESIRRLEVQGAPVLTGTNEDE